ncbi:MAG: DUF4190 domain-containing protein [Candidatus Pristimantibacillus lignocellulolyticus]|uniref:DUF4190 domain-containing protein n=1 Tax=Candidatus Pristimantibacillus lignocellulolyticus TaxID=2994561 RepID=A0A9J6ZKD8_9BACL|nr:MAG: DUF4190 domain-containing protein [Candidatus Pristimantibacillus lignocellulolyticus]
MSDQSNQKDFPYGNPIGNNDLTDSQSQQSDQQTNQPTANSNGTDGYNSYDQSNGQHSTYVNNGHNQQPPYNNQYQQPVQQNFQPYQQPQQQSYQQSPPNYNNQQPYNGQDQYYGQAQNGNNPNNPLQQQTVIYRSNKTNTKSIIGLIFGILAIIAPYIGFFFGIAGIILNAMALKEIARKQEDGKGLAISGLITSIVGTLLYGIIFIFLIGLFVFVESTNNMYY